MSDFRTGQRVVCVDGAGVDSQDITCPQRGTLYTIRDIVPESEGRIGVRLVEIKNPFISYWDRSAGRALKSECTFSATRFRSVDKAVVSLF
jgi:hypothetical protein